MKILYASPWMIEALKASSQSLETLLDPAKLLDTLSPDDVGFYLSVNQHLGDFLPKDIVSSFSKVDFDLNRARARGNAKLVKVMDALEDLLYRGKGKTPTEATNEALMLTCDLVGADTILFHYIPKTQAMDDERTKTERTGELLERCLRQLYTVLPFEQLITLPLARLYLEARHWLLKPNRIV